MEQQVANIMQQLAGITGEITSMRQIIQDNDTAVKITIEGEIMLVKQEVAGNITKNEAEIPNIKSVVENVNTALTSLQTEVTGIHTTIPQHAQGILDTRATMIQDGQTRNSKIQLMLNQLKNDVEVQITFAMPQGGDGGGKKEHGGGKPST